MIEVLLRRAVPPMLLMLIGLFFTTFGLRWWFEERPREQVADAVRTFYTALAQNDLALAQEFAGPRLSAELGTRSNSLRVAGAVRLAAVTVTVNAIGRDWARASAEVATQGQDWDVLWYELDLTRTAGAWRVSDARAVLPRAEGKSDDTPRDFDAEPLTRYLEAVQAGDWDGAATHLAGPALAAHRAGQGILGPNRAGLIRYHTAPEVKPLWARGKTVIARGRYQADGRDVSVLVTFYRTGGGWRVVDIRQE